MEKKLILGVRDRPSIKTWILLSIQHVLAMFGATILIPILMGTDAAGNPIISTQVALFSSGVGTLIYIAATKARVPIYLGSSAAFVGAVISLYPSYGNSTFLGFLGVGVLYLIFAIAIKFFGVGWIKKILPPVVVGPMIMIIGLGLAGIAVGDSGLGALVQSANNGSLTMTHWVTVLIAFVTAVSAMLIALLFRGRMKLMPILGAMVIGFALSLIISTFYNKQGSWGSVSKMIDYSSINWKDWKTYISAPNLTHTPFNFSNNGDGNWSFMPFLLMMPVALVTIAEHIGDHTVLGKITGKDYISDEPGLHRTLMGDGLATAFAGLIGGPANTSYGENTTAVGLSKVGSVYVTGLAAVFAIALSFISMLTNIIGLIPKPVIGGLEIILFGFISANGIKVLVGEKVDFSNVRNIFIVSTMLIIGIGGAVIGFQLDSIDFTFSGTSLAMVVGILLATTLPYDKGIDPSKMPKIKNKDIHHGMDGDLKGVL